MTRIAACMLLALSVCNISGGAEPLDAEQQPRDATPQRRFEEILAKYPNMTFQQLSDQTPTRKYVEHLSFDPAKIGFYDQTVEQLELTDVEEKMLRRQGFVSVDHDQQYTFGSLYYTVYTRDLPVLITTDSILHAMHRSYDDILMELEQTYFTSVLEEVLGQCHDELAHIEPKSPEIANSRKDVDLYLTVARNLLKGAGAPGVRDTEKMSPGVDAWNGKLLVTSHFDQDPQAKAILDLIQSLKLQDPRREEFTSVYGGSRAIDYSQFKPRSHYLKTVGLSRYFRAMMWLGRADTGWNVLPPDPQSRIISDSKRELRNAALLTQVMQSSRSSDPLRQMSEIIDFMVGESDNLTVFQTAELLHRQKIADVGDLVSNQQIEELQDALRQNDLGTQRIRSQVIVSDPNDLHQVPPPSTFQMFGQRFVVDSFVLSQVVYDSIIFNGEKVERMMPTGVDVMFALGNSTVLPLLQEEMVKHPYASNLKASQEFVGQFQQSFWRGNLYNIWLDALRTLAVDPSSEKHFPEAMQTAAWQRKQLQTQLASWSELRHDNVLYAKESYTGTPACEYPAGYVEPYPETYARIKLYATEAARRIGAANFKLSKRNNQYVQQREVRFLQQMAESLEKLEALSRKELAAQPFTEEDQAWLKTLIDKRAHGSGPPTYSGWYSELFYGGGPRCAEWDTTIIDVHTDPDSESVLEQGVGNCTFLVVAVDNEENRRIYVGPSYSYYEFRQPAENRLTDEQWRQMLTSRAELEWPAWANEFRTPKLKRSLGK